MVDDIAASHRYALIPGAAAAVEVARSKGALGASLAGSGPTVFALCVGAEHAGQVGRDMAACFEEAGVDSRLRVTELCSQGARIL